MDKHNEQNGCYGNEFSKNICKICGVHIPYADLKVSKQDDGSYICPACQHDIDADELRVKKYNEGIV